MLLSLFYLLVAVVPVLFYIGVIWATTPKGDINVKNSFLHFIFGILSISIIFTYFRIFPNCHEVLPINESLAIFIFSFIQIAFVEEACKFLSFRMGEMIRTNESVEYDRPIATMFYSGISALGFSFIENVTYALKYGGEVLISRSFVAMILHFLCGLIMGYWIAVSRLPLKVKNSSPFEMFIYTRPKLKRFFYYGIGILSAVFIHGLYDFNLFSQGHITSNYLIIFSTVIAGYLAAKDLTEKSKY